MKPFPKLLLLSMVGVLMFAVVSPSALLGSEAKKDFTLRQVYEQVEEAMQGFRNASIAGDITTAQREGIDKAYKEFKTVYDAAVEAAGGKEKAKKVASDKVKAAAETVIAKVASIP